MLDPLAYTHHVPWYMQYMPMTSMSLEPLLSQLANVHAVGSEMGIQRSRLPVPAFLACLPACKPARLLHACTHAMPCLSEVVAVGLMVLMVLVRVRGGGSRVPCTCAPCFGPKV
jgi:hypothetical protein